MSALPASAWIDPQRQAAREAVIRNRVEIRASFHRARKALELAEAQTIAHYPDYCIDSAETRASCAGDLVGIANELAHGLNHAFQPFIDALEAEGEQVSAGWGVVSDSGTLDEITTALTDVRDRLREEDA